MIDISVSFFNEWALLQLKAVAPKSFLLTSFFNFHGGRKDLNKKTSSTHDTIIISADDMAEVRCISLPTQTVEFFLDLKCPNIVSRTQKNWTELISLSKVYKFAPILTRHSLSKCVASLSDYTLSVVLKLNKWALCTFLFTHTQTWPSPSLSVSLQWAPTRAMGSTQTVEVRGSQEGRHRSWCLRWWSPGLL